MLIDGWLSSFRIVVVPVGVAIVAFVGDDNVTLNVSFGSKTTSPLTFTVIVCNVCPGVNVTVPDCAV